MPLVMFPLHKGADGFMSDEEFKKGEEAEEAENQSKGEK